MLVVLGIALSLSRHQDSLADYYLAGNRMRWWQTGLSTMATQLSAISFVSVPAFVALKPGGGLKWIGFEFAVPVALILVMALLVPLLHRSHYISIYEYLEDRFDYSTRALVGLLFLLGRGLSTAVAVLAGAVVLSAALGVSTLYCILVVGFMTVIYDALGGIGVVILSDVLQMTIIVVGLLFCLGVALGHTGPAGFWTGLSPERVRVFDFSPGISRRGTFGFWPLFFGGIFLYASYYGCDQSQVQRELAVEDEESVRLSLLVNALARYPLTLLYCSVGVLVGAMLTEPGVIETMAETVGSSVSDFRRTLDQNPDRMLPVFIMGYLPHGLIGLVFAGVLSALMSSLDSAINSLSAVTMRDYYQPLFGEGNPGENVVISRLITLFWGCFCVGGAVLFRRADRTLVELINQVGSLFYGPMLGAFLLGMTTHWARARGVRWGIVGGIGLNVLLWQGTSVSWFWWSLTGFLVVVLACLLDALATRSTDFLVASSWRWDVEIREPRHNWNGIYAGCLLYTLLILGVSYAIQQGALWLVRA